MPAAVPLISVVAGAAISTSSVVAGALGSAFAAQLLGGATSFALNALGSRAGAKKPKAQQQTTFDPGLKQTIRLSSDTAKIVYGRARIGGNLAYAESTSSGTNSLGTSVTGDNVFLHMILVHTCHEIDAIEEVYLNDKLVTLDANGFVTDSEFTREGNSYVRIKHHLGYDTQTADANLVSEVTNWTTSHMLRGWSYTYMRLQWNQEVFQSGLPGLNVVMRGKKVYDPRLPIDDGSVADAVIDTVDYGAASDSVDYIIDDGSVADPITMGGYVWTDNAALCVNDYLTSRDIISIPYGLGLESDEIDSEYTASSANICDESLYKLDGSTVKRYTLNGIIDTEKSVKSNIDDMLSSMVGAVSESGGVFRIHAGAYETPESESIDESWLTGSIKCRPRTPRQELFNAVKGTYIEPSKAWQSDSFTPVTSSTFEDQDNGERIYTDIELPFTIDNEAAQRIAKVIQLKAREQITLSMPVNYRALKFKVWDNVKVTNAKRGWADKVFKIIGMSFDLTAGIVLQLREENHTSYNWLTTDAEAIAASPDTNLPNPFEVQAPTGMLYNSRSVGTVGGDSIYNLVLQWNLHSDAFVSNGGQFEIQFKLSTESNWRPSFFVNGSLTTSDIVSSSVNTSYDLRIRAVNMLGNVSGWSTIYNAIIGSSGGVSATNDWGNWTSAPSSFADWGNWTTSPSGSDDWGYFT